MEQTAAPVGVVTPDMGEHVRDSVGFRPAASGSGLLVPEELSRERETWTNDDWKRVKRGLAFLAEHGLAVVMRCTQPGCRQVPLETLTQPDGTTVIRCEHKDRVIRKGVPNG